MEARRQAETGRIKPVAASQATVRRAPDLLWLPEGCFIRNNIEKHPTHSFQFSRPGVEIGRTQLLFESRLEIDWPFVFMDLARFLFEVVSRLAVPAPRALQKPGGQAFPSPQNLLEVGPQQGRSCPLDSPAPCTDSGTTRLRPQCPLCPSASENPPQLTYATMAAATEGCNSTVRWSLAPARLRKSKKETRNSKIA